MYNNKPVLRSINELIRWIDATRAEKRYLIKKFPTNYNLIDTQAQMNIRGISKTLSTMKYYHGLNLYEELDSARNNGTKAKECL